MINFFSKHFVLCICIDVYKVRIFNLESFVINTRANSQWWQKRAAGSVNSTLFLNHISELRWHISSSFKRKEKSWAHSDSKIIGFTTSLQMCKLETCYCFVMATKLHFFLFVSCSLHYLNTIYYSEVALHIFTLFFMMWHKFPCLRTIIIFQIIFQR